MKIKLMIVALALCVAGCAVTTQTVAYKTLYSVEKVTTGAYDGYLDSVIQGVTSTNAMPRVSSAYNKFQTSLIVALDAVQFNTNALAPDSLVIESGDLINLISAVKGK